MTSKLTSSLVVYDLSTQSVVHRWQSTTWEFITHAGTRSSPTQTSSIQVLG